MSVLCPKCGSAHVARLFDDDTKFDIAFSCHDCGFEYSVPTIPETKMVSKYDADRYDGPAFTRIQSDPADDRQPQRVDGIPF